MPERFTIIDDGQVRETIATIGDGSVRLPAEALRSALGYELKPEGLCKDALCFPVVPAKVGPALVTDRGIDLAGIAALTSRPLAIDLEEHTACLGVSAAARAQQLTSLEAPDFTLHDLDGRPHSLSDYRGKKVMLLAWASW